MKSPVNVYQSATTPGNYKVFLFLVDILEIWLGLTFPSVAVSRNPPLGDIKPLNDIKFSVN
jgi:hypothetical protein